MQIGWLLLLDSQRDGTCPDDELEGKESCGEETGDGDESCCGEENCGDGESWGGNGSCASAPGSVRIGALMKPRPTSSPTFSPWSSNRSCSRSSSRAARMISSSCFCVALAMWSLLISVSSVMTSGGTFLGSHFL